MRHPPSVRAWLVALTLGVLIPVLGFGALVVAEYAASERRRLEQGAQSIARAVAADIESALDSHRTMLEVLAASTALQRGEFASVRDQAAAVLRREGVDMVLADGRGVRIADTGLTEAVLPPEAPDPVLAAAARGTPAVSGILTDPLRAVPAVLLAVPVRDAAGAPRGALAARLDLREIAHLLTRETLPPTWSAAVADGAGRLIARSGGVSRHVGARLDFLPVRIDATPALQRIINLDGVPTLAAFARPGFAGWTVLVGIPEAVAQAPMRRSLVVLGAFGLGLTAVALALALLVGRRIEAPLRALQAQAAAGGAGGPAGQGLRETEAAGAALAEAFARERARAAQLRGLAEAATAAAAAASLRGRLAVVAEAACRLLGAPGAVAEVATAAGSLRVVAGTAGPAGPSVPIGARDGGILGCLLLAGPVAATPEEAGPVLAPLARLAASAVEQDEAEAALRESEARYRALIEISPQVVFLADAAGGITYGNATWHELTGRPADDDVMAGWIEALHPEDRERVVGLWRRAVAEGVPVEAELRLRRAADGRHLWHLAKAVPVPGPDGRPDSWIGVAVDIDELRRAKERLEIVLRGADLGTWHWNIPTGEVAFNPRWAEMLGYRPEEIAPGIASVAALLHPDDRPHMRATLEAHLEGRTAFYESEHRMRHRDGHWVWVLDRGRVVERDAEGRPLIATGTHLDVTERHEAEAALRESEQRFRQVAAAIDDVLWIVEPGTRRTLYVSPAYPRIFGRPAEGLLRDWANWAEAIHPEDRDAAVAAFREGIAAGGFDREYRVLLPGGQSRWVRDRGYVLPAAEGRPVRVVGIASDQTELRRAGERQQLLMRELDHRAKNALAVVQSVVRLTRAEDPRDFAAAVEGRIAALARAHTLLAARRWTGAELGAVAEAEFAAHRTGATRRVELEGPRVALQPDAVQPIAMVLHELATNAVRHGALSRPGGRATLSWWLEPEQGGLGLSWTERGGPPVRPPTRRGFGSTLIEATARGQLGGRIAWLWEEEGLRCLLRVAPRHLAPATEPAAPQPPVPGPVPAPAASLAGLRVLVAEDEPLVALEIETALRALGCEVAGPVATVEEAMALAEAETPPDAAVLDVNLGGRPVFPAAERLAERGVPIVFASGYGELPGWARDRDAALLRKPLARGELEAALGRALAARREVVGVA